MEIKSLVLGLAFSLGIFAVKSGAGLSFLFARKVTLSGRLAVLCGFISGYGIVFFLAWFLAGKTDLLAHLDTTMLLLKNGMTIHFLLAALLLARGTALLRGKQGGKSRSHGWLLLTLPCPVCFSVILFSGAFLNKMLPDIPYLFAWLFAGFISVSLMGGQGLSLTQHGDPGHTLGTVMVLAALYFLLTIAVAPQFGEIERIYRLSQTSATTLADSRLFLLSAVMGVAFTAGFLKTVWRLPWK